MLTHDHLARFAKAAPVEWNAAENQGRLLRFTPDGVSSFVIIREGWFLSDQRKFVGWGIGWLMGLSPQVTRGHVEGAMAGVTTYDKSHKSHKQVWGDTLAEAVFLAILYVLENPDAI